MDLFENNDNENGDFFFILISFQSVQIEKRSNYCMSINRHVSWILVLNRVGFQQLLQTIQQLTKVINHASSNFNHFFTKF